jgi:hypothetical protein
MVSVSSSPAAGDNSRSLRPRGRCESEMRWTARRTRMSPALAFTPLTGTKDGRASRQASPAKRGHHVAGHVRPCQRMPALPVGLMWAFLRTRANWTFTAFSPQSRAWQHIYSSWIANPTQSASAVPSRPQCACSGQVARRHTASRQSTPWPTQGAPCGGRR